uniref:Uncharacterized protein n=1 Tax=Anguilla anguilla TaxID=7936 RepID=A0A0E9WQI7_ANGAN
MHDQNTLKGLVSLVNSVKSIAHTHSSFYPLKFTHGKQTLPRFPLLHSSFTSIDHQLKCHTREATSISCFQMAEN